MSNAAAASNAAANNAAASNAAAAHLERLRMRYQSDPAYRQAKIDAARARYGVLRKIHVAARDDPVAAELYKRLMERVEEHNGTVGTVGGPTVR